MLLEELKVPFRWYDDPTRKLKAKEECGNYKYKLITPADRLLPFMIRYPSNGTIQLPISWKIYNSSDDTLAKDLAAHLNLIEYYTTNDFDYLVYKGGSMFLSTPLDSGFYYSVIEVQDNYKVLTSEDFWIDCDLAGRFIGSDFSDDFNDDFGPLDTEGGLKKYTKLEWWHSCDIGPLLYQTGYHNILYFDTELIKDEPQILEESEEDGNKDLIVKFIKYIDNIRFDDFVPEYIVNALLPVRLHKNVAITTKDNLYTGTAKGMIVKHTWYRCYAKVDITFQQQTIYARGSCCENNVLQNNYECAATISAVTVEFDDTGDNTLHLEWTVLTGTPDKFRVESPDLNGGLPFDTEDLFYDETPIDDTTTRTISGTVKPMCLHPVTGAPSFGPAQPFEISFPLCTPVSIPDLPMFPDAVVDQPYSLNIDLAGDAPFALGAQTKPTWMNTAIVGSQLQITGTPLTGDEQTNFDISIEITNCAGANNVIIDETIDILAEELYYYLADEYNCNDCAGFPTQENILVSLPSNVFVEVGKFYKPVSSELFVYTLDSAYQAPGTAIALESTAYTTCAGACSA